MLRRSATTLTLAALMLGGAACSKAGEGGAQAAPAAAASSGAKAQGQKPGQWNVIMKIYMTGIPAEQMAQLREAGMAGMFTGEPETIKYCVTPERAARGLFFESEQNGCAYTNLKVAGSGASADMDCPGPDLKGTGKMSITASSDTAFAGGWSVSGSDAAGNAVKQEVKVTGAWVKGDCDADAQK